MSVAVEAKDLTKVFGSVRALDGLNFSIEEGEIFGLIGLNGAGKTTALRVTATLLLPTSGTITVFGHDVVEEAPEVRNLISYLPEEAGAYKNLSGLEYLRFMASFRANDKAAVKDLVDVASEISGLGERLRDKVKGYSKGMKRRLL
ncbi:ABC transporter ATP-binding protein, partial [bacterium]